MMIIKLNLEMDKFCFICRKLMIFFMLKHQQVVEMHERFIATSAVAIKINVWSQILKENRKK